MSVNVAELSAKISSTKGVHLADDWLKAFLETQRPTTPIQSLIQTAYFRFLTSDIAKSLRRETCLPRNIADSDIQTRTLKGGVVVQILGVEDISRSRWEQIEAIEAIERGEMTRGREIIRTVTLESNRGDPDVATMGSKKGGVHKLLLQDSAGTLVYGLELRPVGGLTVGMNIGSKMLLRDAVVARGMVLLEPESTSLLGGKIDGLHSAWMEGRKQRLREGIDNQD